MAAPVNWLGIAERLLAGAAIVGGTIYVLINALYIEFYDDFGVRPEQVGLDRLAVLGRVAWIALVGIAAVGAAAWLFTLAPVLDRLGGGHVTGIAALVATIVLLGGFWFLQGAVETEADRVRRGETVNGLSFVVPFIDLPVNRATVTWIGDSAPPPGLDSPHLMYLGRGPDVAAFVSCGRDTIVVPADDVVITIQRHLAPPDKASARQRRELDRAC